MKNLIAPNTHVLPSFMPIGNGLSNFNQQYMENAHPIYGQSVGINSFYSITSNSPSIQTSMNRNFLICNTKFAKNNNKSKKYNIVISLV